MKDLFLQPVNKNDGDLYYCHWQSVLASFNQIVEEIKELGLSKDIGILNLDDFADIKEYPQQDFVILRHVTMDSDSKNIYVDFNVGVSTWADANNHKLSKIISYVFGRYAPGKAFRVLDKEGVEKGVLTSTEGTMINQMSKSEMRSTQFITVAAVSTATLS